MNISDIAETNNFAVQVVDIRDLSLLDSKPWLYEIRAAMISSFDYLYTLNDGRTDYEDNYTSAAQLNKITLNKCDLASNVVLHYLDILYPGEYDNFLYKATTNLHYFNNFHQVAIIFHKASQTFIAASPANVCNGDFSLPVFRGKEFQRCTNIILASKLDILIKIISEIEGGDDWQNVSRMDDDMRSSFYDSITNGPGSISFREHILANRKV